MSLWKCIHSQRTMPVKVTLDTEHIESVSCVTDSTFNITYLPLSFFLPFKGSNCSLSSHKKSEISRTLRGCLDEVFPSKSSGWGFFKTKSLPITVVQGGQKGYVHRASGVWLFTTVSLTLILISQNGTPRTSTHIIRDSYKRSQYQRREISLPLNKCLNTSDDHSPVWLSGKDESRPESQHQRLYSHR